MEELRNILSNIDTNEFGLPLAVLYGRCHAVHSQQDRLISSKDFHLIDAAIALFLRTETAAETVGIFSANEDRDDLATADIKYLLVPFYRGALLSAVPVRTDSAEGPSTSRLAAVSRALPALDTFLQRCEQYELLGELGSAGTDVVAADPAAKRTFKVEKFKREKMLSASLGMLESRRAAAATQEREDESARALSSAGPTGAAPLPGGAAAVAGGGLDEEDERQLWVWRVELAALQALDLKMALKQEMELLQHAAAREAAAATAGPGPSSGAPGRAAGAGAAEEAGPGQAGRVELMERLRAICRDLDGNKREQVRRDVFKPSHILPTMTVEEAGEIEMQEAMEREARQRKRDEKEKARRDALDSEEEDAEDKAKQRTFDDWRDSHPKGYGNSKLRPCG